MRTSWYVSDGNSGCSLNAWMGLAISRGIELRDEDIVAICLAAPGTVLAGMNRHDIETIKASGENNV